MSLTTNSLLQHTVGADEVLLTTLLKNVENVCILKILEKCTKRKYYPTKCIHVQKFANVKTHTSINA